jgi:site-specific recombinase XerC
MRGNSSLTRQDRLNCLGRIGKYMQAYGLENIKDIKPKHVERYFAKLRSQGMSPARMANHATAMRTLCRMMGKSDIVGSNQQLGCSRDLKNRTKHSDERMDASKAAEVRATLSESCRIAYDMARQFGLRQKETLLTHQVVSREAGQYLIVEGAKGGRPRELPITTAAQRELLALNHAYRKGHGGTLIDGNKTLKQGLRQLQNELAAAGATRESLANMHTLRREWIIVRCHVIYHSPEPSRQDLLAELAELVGHGRVEVLRCYISLLPKD